MVHASAHDLKRGGEGSRLGGQGREWARGGGERSVQESRLFSARRSVRRWWKCITTDSSLTLPPRSRAASGGRPSLNVSARDPPSDPLSSECCLFGTTFSFGLRYISCRNKEE